MNVLVYDIEISKAILAKGEKESPAVEYCLGWTDYRGMGVATIGVYDFKEFRFRVFGQKDIQLFNDLLITRDYIVGWNNHSFDDEILRANGIDPGEKSIDFMNVFGELSGSRVKLDHALEANGIATKSGHGKDAPILWQRGFYNRVIDYCLEDVRLTAKLLQKGLKRGALNHPYPEKTGGALVQMGKYAELFEAAFAI